MKMKLAKPKLNRQILDEASGWFVDFRVGDVDLSARERFDQWLRQSPEHIRAYMEIARTYVELPPLNADRKIGVQALIACARADDRANVVALDRPAVSQVLTVQEALSTPGQDRERHRGQNEQARASGSEARASGTDSDRHRRFVVRALAAGVALAMVASSLFVGYVLTRVPVYATDIGERRSLTLADGSTIDLNSRSRIRVHFTKVERDVELLDGQALFEVAKDPARPFIVKSGATWVRAVGTQFQVDRKSSGVTVTVVEGRVMVLAAGGAGVGGNAGAGSTVGAGSGLLPLPGPRQAQDSRAGGVAASPESTSLSAGEEVTVADGVMAAPKRANIAQATAWMQHRLIFDASRLADVVDEFNRYNARQLVIENTELAELHISGVYSSTDPTSLIRFPKEQPGVQIVEADSVVRITRP